MLTTLTTLLLAASGPMFVENPKTDANQAVIEQFYRYNDHCKTILFMMTDADDFKTLINAIAKTHSYTDQERINLQNHCLIYSGGVALNFEDRKK